ncbi:GGDEF domain-containing protein [Psychrobacillus lasiicapitis]|uniref:GGDEF domain-containing protein n=1 Tax=Psychrobacillus lasiicapitis TaxID=1636719 RepID=UPI001476D4B6|nr:GGDEF domain-containing protein [Psychrobacillus lasiicapitis]
MKKEFTKQKKIVENFDQMNVNLSTEEFYDDLTKLANRKYFTESLSQFRNDEGNADIWVALLIIDVDYLRRYNDFHGPIEGNRAIQKIGDCLKKVIEKYGGVAGKFGGDEFVAFLKHISQSELKKIAEELRTSVEEMSLLYCSEQHAYALTISVGGVLGQCKQFDSMDDMNTIACKELNKSKINGKNQVTIYVK